MNSIKLKMLPLREYVGVNRNDPIRFYFKPFIGTAYRRRVELCLEQLNGGQRILEIGFGSGVTFLNLHELYPEIHGLDLTAKADEIAALFVSKGVPTNLINGSVLNMPYPDNYFDSVLLISILEHLNPAEQPKAFAEIKRVLKPGGQVVYGVPVDRPFVTFMFRLLGYNIRKHHFSSHIDVAKTARSLMKEISLTTMKGPLSLFGAIYEVGCFVK